MKKIAAVAIVLALNAYVYWYFGSAETIPPRTEFTLFPDEVEDWKCTQRETLDDQTLHNLQVTDYLSCSFLQRGASFVQEEGRGERRPPPEGLVAQGQRLVRRHDHRVQRPDQAHYYL